MTDFVIVGLIPEMARDLSVSVLAADLLVCLYHAPGIARRADSTALAGEGHKVVVPAVTTAGTGKAVDKDVTFEVFAKRLAHIGDWRVRCELKGSHFSLE
jgi:hypothetical protein